jgi:hypothetical protein
VWIPLQCQPGARQIESSHAYTFDLSRESLYEPDTRGAMDAVHVKLRSSTSVFCVYSVVSKELRRIQLSEEQWVLFD